VPCWNTQWIKLKKTTNRRLLVCGKLMKLEFLFIINYSPSLLNCCIHVKREMQIGFVWFFIQ